MLKFMLYKDKWVNVSISLGEISPQSIKDRLNI